MKLELFSGVELREPVEGFPRGAIGNVVEILNDAHALVEMFDTAGESVDVVDIPVTLLRVVRYSRGRLLSSEPAVVR
jgi:hypothetical protein